MGLFSWFSGNKSNTPEFAHEFDYDSNGQIRGLWISDPKRATSSEFLKTLVALETKNNRGLSKDAGLAAYINVTTGYYDVISDPSGRDGVYLYFGDS